MRRINCVGFLLHGRNKSGGLAFDEEPPSGSHSYGSLRQTRQNSTDSVYISSLTEPSLSGTAKPDSADSRSIGERTKAIEAELQSGCRGIDQIDISAPGRLAGWADVPVAPALDPPWDLYGFDEH